MKYLQIHPPVQAALAANRAVVAFETSLISHGLPWPKNFETGQKMEAAAQAQGATPATIAVHQGKIRIGCDAPLLEHFARAEGVLKVGRKDLSAAIAEGRDGGTTVSATIHCAAAAGINIFATGGIGGVHRGGEKSFDISADLSALGRTAITTVCSGAKSILDLAKTLEVLESQNVLVIGFGTDSFPAFYARESGLKLEHRVDTPEQAAEILRAQHALAMESAVLIVNPIDEEFAIDWHDLKIWTEQAEVEAATEGVSGKALTPFLLSRIGALSQGRTLAANQALAVGNAELAAQIAVALAATGIE
ncbi:MAG: pseudouridine-5'-phosphate glycosidase [Rhodospirillaceae bacterium]|nr:pseudouridine-5'-phosphate glycosidase [Rhodospirillaceae bacterium]